MLKLVIALVLLAHGIGHSMGILGVAKIATVNPQWRGDSWLLSGAVGNGAAGLFGVVLWTLAIAGFAALAAVVLGWLPQAWFQPLAIASSVVSLVGVLFFPMAFPVFSTLGAVAVDVAVLAAVLWAHWIPADLAG